MGFSERVHRPSGSPKIGIEFSKLEATIKRRFDDLYQSPLTGTLSDGQTPAALPYELVIQAVKDRMLIKAFEALGGSHLPQLDADIMTDIIANYPQAVPQKVLGTRKLSSDLDQMAQKLALEVGSGHLQVKAQGRVC